MATQFIEEVYSKNSAQRKCNGIYFQIYINYHSIKQLFWKWRASFISIVSFLKCKFLHQSLKQYSSLLYFTRCSCSWRFYNGICDVFLLIPSLLAVKMARFWVDYETQTAVYLFSLPQTLVGAFQMHFPHSIEAECSRNSIKWADSLIQRLTGRR